MIKFAGFLGLLLGLIATACAVPLERDLGHGLAYVRPQFLPADLPSGVGRGAMVLDLRYAETDAAGSAAISSWLSQHASATHPVFVLLNSATGTGLRGLFSPGSRRAGVLVIGPDNMEPSPDIVIDILPEIERQAYDALPGLTEIKPLIESIPEKMRQDEASLLEANRHDRDLADEPEPELTDSPAKPGPLIDLALQRTVQIHQGWLILGSKTP